MILEGFEKRLRLPDTCPVCNAVPVNYDGRYDNKDRWIHMINYKCGCVMMLIEKKSNNPIVQHSCPEAHRIAVKLLKTEKNVNF